MESFLAVHRRIVFRHKINQLRLSCALVSHRVNVKEISVMLGLSGSPQLSISERTTKTVAFPNIDRDRRGGVLGKYVATALPGQQEAVGLLSANQGVRIISARPAFKGMAISHGFAPGCLAVIRVAGKGMR